MNSNSVDALGQESESDRRGRTATTTDLVVHGSLDWWECAKVGKFPNVHKSAIARETKIIPAGIDKLRRCRDIRLWS
jgi:hypothetical protein